MPLFFDKETETSLLMMMRDYPLASDELLWLGPEAIKILAEPNGFKGKLPGKLVLKKSELKVRRD